MHGHQLKVADVFKFVFAGNSTFTIVEGETRRTFKLQRAEGADSDRPWFAKLMTGPDNNRSFTFFGTVFPSEDGPIFRRSAKSTISEGAPGVVAFSKFVGLLAGLARAERAVFESKVAGELFAPAEISDEVADLLDQFGEIEVWHEGRCGRCGRKLTVPESIANGIGPDCAEKAA